MLDVIILTEQRYVNPTIVDPYIQNVLDEDNYVKKALENQGLKVLRLSWDDPNFDWKTTKSVIFRSIWDYFERFNEFSLWLNSISKQTRLFNSEAIIRWNIDKHYLLDLKKAGIHICESYFIEKKTKTTLEQLHKKLGWKETILKPCISGSARHTYRLDQDNLANHETIFQELIKLESMMLQPFQYSVLEKGEVSYMVMNGKFTHAILKKAKKGDFRVQDDFGGTIQEYQATQKEIDFTQNAVKACPELPIYARVDVIIDNDQKLAISEIELIEPELWFRKNPTAANLIALAVKKQLEKIN